MTATIMDGRQVAQRLLTEAGQRVQRIVRGSGVTPALATVLVGDDPASATYVRMKARRCEEAGMRSLKVELPADTTTAGLVTRIEQLGADRAVHGILLQHPVPAGIEERAAFEAIRPEKDVDGVTIHSFGTTALARPGGPVGPGCCTPRGMMHLLEAYAVPIEGARAVVVGRSAIVGLPMAMMLMAANGTVTICHSRTRDLGAVVGEADIVVAAVGRPRFIQGGWIKPGAVVLDAGYNEGNVGDVDFDTAVERAGMISPVPGGVGPMTIATLIDQTSVCAARQLGVES